MKFTEDIFKRATVRGVADYLLFGETPIEEKRDYETRIDDAYARFKNVVMQQEAKGSEQVLDLADEMVGEHMSVFMEIGLQAGILLILDLLQNIYSERYKDCSEVGDEKESN